MEVIESALRFAGLIDYSPWSIRNQFLPQRIVGLFLLASPPLKAADPFFQVFALRSLFALVGGGLTIWLTYRLSYRLYRENGIGELAALLVSVHPLAVAFGATTSPRVFSTAFILASTLLVIRPHPRFLHCLWAGSLLGAAFACRYSEVIFLPPLLVATALEVQRGRVRAVVGIVLGFLGAVLVLVGIEDWLAWGQPFASLKEFAQYTLVEKQSSAEVAVQPFAWYAKRLLFWVPATFVPAVLFIPGSRKPASQLALLIAVPVLLLSFVHHKDLRYVHGVLPYVAILAASGLWRLRTRAAIWGKVASTVLVVLTVLIGLARSASILSRNSNAAVRAARVLSLDHDLDAIGVSQVWAFGGRVILRGKSRIVELGMPPTAAGLKSETPGLDAVALYEEAVMEDSDLVSRLHDLGFSDWRSVSGGAGRSVVLLRRTAPSE